MKIKLDIWPTDLNIKRDLLIEDYLPTTFESSWTECSWVISYTRCGRLTWPLTFTFDLHINRNHLLIKDYLPTKIEASAFLSYQLHKVKGYRYIDRHTGRPTDMYKAICLPFFEGGINIANVILRVGGGKSDMPIFFSDSDRGFFFCDKPTWMTDEECIQRLLRYQSENRLSLPF